MCTSFANHFKQNYSNLYFSWKTVTRPCRSNNEKEKSSGKNELCTIRLTPSGIKRPLQNLMQKQLHKCTGDSLYLYLYGYWKWLTINRLYCLQ